MNYQFDFFLIFSSTYLQGDALNLLITDTGKNEKHASLTTHVNISYFNSKSIKHGNYIQMMENRFCFMPLTIYFRKNSFLSPLIGDTILDLTTNGLMGKWTKNYLRSNLLRPQNIKKIFQEPRKLTFIQIQGAVIICGCLHLIAICIFVCEIIFKKINN